MNTESVTYWTPAGLDFTLSAYWEGGYHNSPSFYPFPKSWNLDTYFWFINGDSITLHLVLTHHWYDETTKAENPKRIEYRAMTPRWMKLIYGRRFLIGSVRFARGYTSTTTEFRVTHIDIGPCPIPGWDGDYIRIHFTDQP